MKRAPFRQVLAALIVGLSSEGCWCWNWEATPVEVGETIDVSQSDLVALAEQLDTDLTDTDLPEISYEDVLAYCLNLCSMEGINYAEKCSPVEVIEDGRGVWECRWTAVMVCE